MTDIITIINNASNNGGDVFPQEFSIKINNLSTNPIKNADKKGKRYCEFYLVNQNDDFIFPGMAIWGNRNKFLIITKFVSITEWKNVPINIEERKKQNGIPASWGLFLFKTSTLAPSEQINNSDAHESLRKVMEERMKNEISATKSRFEFEIDELKKRAETWKKMYEKNQDQLDDFMNEQFQKNVDRSKRMVKTITGMAAGEIEYSLEETAKIEDREIERGNNDE